ncbi:3373_t:CDS:2 [Cetraspora pellucida]|uniref:3373_t:CDS:1 n=1 Tax=Cetraspora pellucida TaxID=1433469 RepID=A0A9N8VIP4_9GLOM|nr:3373_t:CDS:2 [Cetraspora pellucida]
MLAFSNNITNNRDQRPEDNILNFENKNKKNFISETSKNNEISNSKGNKNDNSMLNLVKELIEELTKELTKVLIKVAEIIIDLSSKMLNDKEIITMVQAEENKQEQESNNNNKEPSPLSVIAKEMYNIIQTVLQYKEQTNSESNLKLAKLKFLYKLITTTGIYMESPKTNTNYNFFYF